MTALARCCAALRGAGVRYAVVGGYAVALHGAVRGTVDLDVVVNWNLKSLRGAERALKGLGMVSRLPVTADDVFNFRDEYIAKRNLIAWNFYNPRDLSEQVDVIINYDLAGKRTRRFDLPGGPVQVLSLPDLIAMKRQAGRPQDLEDVAALARLR